MAKIAQCGYPALLLGETGTGKEIAARAIHEQSGLRGAFVAIDCSCITGSLLESELFGHTKGAFTGAISAKTGLLEAARGGTAFFDEIGELPLDSQSKLLRALQEKEFRPVGSLITHRCDFRIIAATNRDLAQEVERGTFRRDLYYRINVMTLNLAPLRERAEDIAVLVAHFLDRAGTGHTICDETMRLMMAYPWPGNIRELEHCVQRMLAMSGGAVLEPSDLPPHIRFFTLPESVQPAAGSKVPFQPPAAAFAASAGAGSEPQSLVVPLVELERRAILSALEYAGGNQAMTAHLLGIGRTTLFRKLKEYGKRTDPSA